MTDWWTVSKDTGNMAFNFAPVTWDPDNEEDWWTMVEDTDDVYTDDGLLQITEPNIFDHAATKRNSKYAAMAPSSPTLSHRSTASTNSNSSTNSITAPYGTGGVTSSTDTLVTKTMDGRSQPIQSTTSPGEAQAGIREVGYEGTTSLLRPQSLQLWGPGTVNDFGRVAKQVSLRL